MTYINLRRKILFFALFFQLLFQVFGFAQESINVQTIRENESDGFFGYHATSTSHWILNETIKCVLSDLGSIDLPDDYYFLRIPGSAQLSEGGVKEYRSLFVEYDDTRPLQQGMLASLNIDLLANLDDPKESTWTIFLSNCSVSGKGAEIWIDDLELFLVQAGMDSGTALKVYELGASLCASDRGVLLQLFAPSSDFEGFLHRNTFCAAPKGQPDFDCSPLDLLRQRSRDWGRYNQLRLVMNHRETVNPYSGLRMRIYHGTNHEERKLFSEELQKVLRQNLCDKNRLIQLVNSIEKKWMLCRRQI